MRMKNDFWMIKIYPGQQCVKTGIQRLSTMAGATPD